MPQINFTSFPALTTERLTLRQLSGDDSQALSSLRSDNRVNKYIDRPAQCSMEDAKTFILKINNEIKQNKCFYWAICARNKSELIGTICLWNFSDDRTIAELGYELNPGYQGKGLMNEAIAMVIKYSFQVIGLKMLEAFVHKENNRSIRLMERNGFKPCLNRIDEKNTNNIIYCLNSAISRHN